MRPGILPALFISLMTISIAMQSSAIAGAPFCNPGSTAMWKPLKGKDYGALEFRSIWKRHEATLILPHQFLRIVMKDGQTARGVFQGGIGNTIYIRDFDLEATARKDEITAPHEKYYYYEINLENIKSLNVHSGYPMSNYSENGLFGMKKGDPIRLVQHEYASYHPELGISYRYVQYSGFAIEETPEYVELYVSKVEAVDGMDVGSRVYDSVFALPNVVGKTIKAYKPISTVERYVQLIPNPGLARALSPLTQVPQSIRRMFLNFWSVW